MNTTNKYLTQIVAIFIICVVFFFVKTENLTLAEKEELSLGVQFNKDKLYQLEERPNNIREVNPSLSHIDAWISSVGASAAINDLDNDGVSNDICHIDPRYNAVIIQQVGKQNLDYDSFVLPFDGIRYDNTMAPMGCLPGDINEDGLMDILVYFWGRTPIAFLQKDNEHLSEKSFTPLELIDTKERWYSNAATLADIDGDGHKDLVIGNYFEDGARILDKNSLIPDHMQDSMSKAFNGGGNKFLIWKGTSNEEAVKYELIENVLPIEYSNGWTLAVGAADLNNDMMPEIYFANDFGPDRMLLNNSTPGNLHFKLVEGEKSIEIPKSSTVGRDSFKGMGVDFGDINNDQLLDLYVSNIADDYALHESHFMFVSNGNIDDFNKGIAPYINKSEELGLSRSSWGWDSKLSDLNNDGNLEAIQATGFIKGERNEWAKLQELAMTNDEMLKNPTSWPNITQGSDLSGDAHNPIYFKGDDGKFYDVSEALGTDEPQITRGIASGDIDADGDIDLVYANQWQDSYLYTNQCNELCGESITLNLLIPIDQEINKTQVIPAKEIFESKGVTPIGAVVEATLSSGKKITRFVDGGNGHSGKRSYELHFGLGSNDDVTQFTLRWRNFHGEIEKETISLAPGRYTVLLKN